MCTEDIMLLWQAQDHHSFLSDHTFSLYSCPRLGKGGGGLSALVPGTLPSPAALNCCRHFIPTNSQSLPNIQPDCVRLFQRFHLLPFWYLYCIGPNIWNTLWGCGWWRNKKWPSIDPCGTTEIIWIWRRDTCSMVRKIRVKSLTFNTINTNCT